MKKFTDILLEGSYSVKKTYNSAMGKAGFVKTGSVDEIKKHFEMTLKKGAKGRRVVMKRPKTIRDLVDALNAAAENLDFDETFEVVKG